MKHHDLKTDPEAFAKTAAGQKPWEIRKNDRDFQEGDTVTLHETRATGADMANGAPLEYTGRKAQGIIDWILHGPQYGLADGWCIFTLLVETPEARWRENGESDPHGQSYDRERSQLSCGLLTDDELAYALFVCDHHTSPHSIIFLTAARDRIRWLSRRLREAKERAQNQPAGELQLMGNLRIDDDGTTQPYDRALLITFDSEEATREAIIAGQCTFTFQE